MNDCQPKTSELGKPPNKGSNVQPAYDKDKQIEELTKRVAMLEETICRQGRELNNLHYEFNIAMRGLMGQYYKSSFTTPVVSRVDC